LSLSVSTVLPVEGNRKNALIFSPTSGFATLLRKPCNPSAGMLQGVTAAAVKSTCVSSEDSSLRPVRKLRSAIR
jgi:hypothetical protein